MIKPAYQDLEVVLHELQCYDTHALEALRLEAVRYVEQLLNDWAHEYYSNHNHNHNNFVQIQVVTFGSYRLGVHRPSSDLDLLALAPPGISRADFFDQFVSALKQQQELQQQSSGFEDQDQQSIDEIHAIPTAFTPVIKFLFGKRANGSEKTVVKVDLLFVELSDDKKLQEHQTLQSSLQTRLDYYIDDSDLLGLDDVAIRSINGARVSQRLLELVPSIDTYRQVLRGVKAWADSWGLQSNVLGFLGGINWAILAAYICRQHPATTPAWKLLYLFFHTFANWKWPDPVRLIEIVGRPSEGSALNLPMWGSQPRDELHVWPILTPVWPTMNSSYNVGIPQLRRLQDALVSTAYLLETTHCNWKLTLRACPFFERHHYYLQLVLQASNRQDLTKWSRFAETKLRGLIGQLETDQVQPWVFCNFFELPNNNNDHNRSTDNVDTQKHPLQYYFFIGLRFAPNVEQVDLRESVRDFLHKMNAWEGRTPGMDLSLTRITANELPSFVTNMSNINNGNTNSSINEGKLGTEGQKEEPASKRQKVS